MNSLLRPYLPDFLWTDARLIVEVDGFESHGTFKAFKGDRRRDVDLMLERFRVARFTWDDVVHDPGRHGRPNQKASSNWLDSVPRCVPHMRDTRQGTDRLGLPDR